MSIKKGLFTLDAHTNDVDNLIQVSRQQYAAEMRKNEVQIRNISIHTSVNQILMSKEIRDEYIYRKSRWIDDRFMYVDT